jgi:hypothetical protein
VLDLAIVVVLVVVAFRLDDQTVVAERPLLEAGDPYLVSGTPGPVFVPVKVQWYSTVSSLKTMLSMNTWMSGNSEMNERATSVISVGSPPLMAIVPPVTKWSATLVGSWLHQASV